MKTFFVSIMGLFTVSGWISLWSDFTVFPRSGLFSKGGEL